MEAIGLENFNAVTGPVRVRGAEPGDALKIALAAGLLPATWKLVGSRR